ncbi:MAG TPA: undecaprenyl-diphosphate phosphatase [Candidatus Mediterraneibacter gallistercoris]|uniref:Undecaprenyl-diphosphatase n=1 Tax=Candidatus Mediterraneibacter gallistercoris TaxID=2838671 RepID=A0A9D2P5C5_9FIRM|nr:undecaprenyl-diphosphate phosphatase [Candidatus Mediterraneibacter gallistercoris]
MLDILKAIIFGIVEGITEWLPISSTGHLILMEELLKMSQGDEFFEMFQVVIQLGAILAVIVIYFHKLNPFSPKKTQKQKMLTWQIWIKVVIGCVPAGVIGLLFNKQIDKLLYHWYVVAIMLIVYGILFIIVENYQKDKTPQVTKFSQLTIPMILIIGVFQMLALIPGTSRSGATIVGALMIGVSRSLAAEYTFFLAIPVMFGASFVKLLDFGFNFTAMQVVVLLVGMIVSFAVSIVAIKFLMSYIRKNDFKVFGYYRIVLGVIVFLFFGIQALLA